MGSWKFFHIYRLIYIPVGQMFVKAVPLEEKYCALFLRSRVSAGEVFGLHIQ
jgi:hypothetical protein